MPTNEYVIIYNMSLVVIAHNIRSTHNVGSIFRTCEGFGINKIIFTGYTPYPRVINDDRPPHISKKNTAQIAKTALGTESMVDFEYAQDPIDAISKLKEQKYTIVALEQSSGSIMLQSYKTKPKKLALLLGEEVHGITPELIKFCDVTLEIPMTGKKESFNVSVATGIALYELSIKNI
ncbi:MAG: TrmH family RNA methyltransferase [Candidatus Woesebacteria bacterium]|jgi:tRNA G18 (ribose-2'-O)-methylase SpoU